MGVRVETYTFKEMFARLLRPGARGRAARSVEVFGWLILVAGTLFLLTPDFVARVLRLPPLVEQAADYFRLAGLLVGGLGMLYVVSGRLDARGFLFATLLDRPLVPPAMALLWWLEIIPGPLALAFAISDLGGFLWTLFAWRADARRLEERGV